MRRLVLIATAWLALGCTPPPTRADAKAGERDDQAAAPAPTEPSGPPSGCEAPLLQAELTGFCDYDLGVPPMALPKVAWTGESYHPLATRVITFDGEGIRDPEGTGVVPLATWLAEPPRRLPEPGELVFAIAAELPAVQVAELLQGLAKAGRERIRVLVHATDERPVPQPRDTQLLADMRAALPEDHNQRVMFIADRVRAYTELCPELGGVFPQLTQTPPGDRCAKLGDLGSRALVSCGCPKLPELMTLLYALTIGFDPPLGRAVAVELTLDPEQAVTAEAGVSWGQLAAASLTGAEARGFWISD